MEEIKPLNWKKESDDLHSARSGGILYEVERASTGHWWVCRKGYPMKLEETLEEAKHQAEHMSHLDHKGLGYDPRGAL